MSTRPDSRRAAVLLAIAEPEPLDRLTRLFERRGFATATAATAGQAIARLEGSERAVDVVVAAWEPEVALGGELYRWALRHRLALRDRFVFVADEVPADFDRTVGGRCLAIRPAEIEELIRVVEATARRAARRDELGEADAVWLDADRPALLLADGDPALLSAMAQLLGDLGFQVTAVESGHAAIAQLEAGAFDVILTDWHMADGSGADVYRWVCTLQPWMLDRMVVLTGGDVEEAVQVAQGVPVLPKGQDSGALLGLLTATARRTRQAS